MISARVLLMGTGVVLAAVLPVSAQATRTWISGVGDDVNPCSRTAPCKTFAGAISKTAAGGEINIIDPGGYGAVTITKSITLNGAGSHAGILNAGTTGITVNAGADDVVVLRNLSINGAAPLTVGTVRGIRFMAGRKLVVENCDISGQSQRAVSIESSTNNAVVFIGNTTVHTNPNNGIVVNPPAGVVNSVVLDNVRLVNNGLFGLWVRENATVHARRSVTANNGGGVTADGAGAVVMLEDALVAQNGHGLLAQNAGVIRLSNSTVSGNGMGLTTAASGLVESFGQNRVAGNTSGNGPLPTVSLQ